MKTSLPASTGGKGQVMTTFDEFINKTHVANLNCDLTLGELKAITDSTHHVKVPRPEKLMKAIMEGSETVIASSVMPNDGLVFVCKSGMVLYTEGHRGAVICVDKCKGYSYEGIDPFDFAEYDGEDRGEIIERKAQRQIPGQERTFSETFFDSIPWPTRIIIAGSERLAYNANRRENDLDGGTRKALLQKMFEVEQDTAIGVEEEYAANDFCREAFDTMTDHQAEIVKLRMIGYSLTDIGEKLGITPQTVRSNLIAAGKRLIKKGLVPERLMK
ncbi:MAG TPA: hypothetical protein PLN48_09990 [Lachnospiraceae bacterium]|jgi:hypothetical protein|nr:hypothetical protein [Lachnospiraceae bacterium]